MFGGPIVNRLGTKWSLVLGAMSFPIRGSSYYCNSKFGTQWVSMSPGVLTVLRLGCSIDFFDISREL